MKRIRYALLLMLALVLGSCSSVACASVQDASDGPGKLTEAIVASGTPHYIAPVERANGDYGFQYKPLPSTGSSGGPTPTPVTGYGLHVVDMADTPATYPIEKVCVQADREGWFYEHCPSSTLKVGDTFSGVAELTTDEIAAAGTRASSASDYDTEEKRAIIRRDNHFAAGVHEAAYVADPSLLVLLIYDDTETFQAFRLVGRTYQWVDISPVVRGADGRGGTEVEANPSGEASAGLRSVSIDGTIYEVGDDYVPPGEIVINPSTISTYTDVDGDYTLGAEDLAVGTLTAANVDQYEIWFKNESVHTATWAPVADFTVEFNVSTSEETQIGVVATDKIIPVRLVFRSSGTFVSLINTWLEIGGGGGVTSAQLQAEGALREAGDDVQAIVIASAAQLTSALTAQAASDNPLIAIFTHPVTVSGTLYPGGLVIYIAPRSTAIERLYETATQTNLVLNRSIARSAATFTTIVNGQVDDPHMEWIAAEATFSATINGFSYAAQAGDLWYMVPYGTIPQLAYRPPAAPTFEIADGSIGTDQLAARAVTGAKIALQTLTSDHLRIHEQIQLLNPWTDPVRTAIGGAYTIQLPGAGRVDTGNFVVVELNGRAVGSRVAWTQQGSFTVTPDVNDIEAMELVSSTRVIVAVSFYDAASGGNNLGTAIAATSIVPTPPTPYTPSTHVLQAAVNGGDTAGTTSLSLPTTGENYYANFKYLEIAMWEQQRDRIGQALIPIPVLAAQTTNRIIVVNGNPGATNTGSLASVTWNPTARTITAESGDRIIYAALTR